MAEIDFSTLKHFLKVFWQKTAVRNSKLAIHQLIESRIHSFEIFTSLAVHNSSIGDLVTDSVSHSLTHSQDFTN